MFFYVFWSPITQIVFHFSLFTFIIYIGYSPLFLPLFTNTSYLPQLLTTPTVNFHMCSCLHSFREPSPSTPHFPCTDRLPVTPEADPGVAPVAVYPWVVCSFHHSRDALDRAPPFFLPISFFLKLSTTSTDSSSCSSLDRTHFRSPAFSSPLFPALVSQQPTPCSTWTILNELI